MFEKLDQIIHSVHLAYDLTAFDIDKCPKHHQVDNLNEARAWLRNAQTELETLAMGAPTSTFCDWCGLRFEPTSFDREHCTCKEPRDAE